MNTLLSYQLRHTMFILGILLASTGNCYVIFNQYFEVDSFAQANENHSYYLTGNFHAIDIYYANNRSWSHLVTFHTIVGGFLVMSVKYDFPSFHSVETLFRNFSFFQFSYARKALLLFCLLRL